VKTTFCPLQIFVAVAETETVGDTGGFTVIEIEFEFAVSGLAQVEELVSWQVTTSLFKSDALLYVLVFPPTAKPFTRHWYTGLPPGFTTLDEKVTFVPLQMVVCDAEMVIDAGDAVFTVTVTTFDVSETGMAHTVEEVKMHDTASLLFSAVVVNEDEFVPAGLPFTNH
jgi:hypothetical protein